MAGDNLRVRQALLTALALLAGASLLIHSTRHAAHPSAAVFSLLDLLLVTFLFSRSRTAVYGHLLNGMLVLYGVVLMVHYDLATGSSSALTGNLLAGADFFAGIALYRLQIAAIPGPVPLPPRPPPAPRRD